MSKLSKLIKNPKVFWRDFFLKRAPLNYGPGVVTIAAERVKKKPKNILAPKISNDLSYEIAFPIDVVFTWVNSDDPVFLSQREEHFAKINPEVKRHKHEVFDIARFESRDELKYALRSIELHAPWVNHIYIVTNGQTPQWLNLENHKISLIKHSEIIDEKYLPTFNSHVIESCLHRIKNLSEHYIYFNDDVMLTRRVDPKYFFLAGGIIRVFATKSILPNSPKSLYDTPTQWAAKNSRNLIFNSYGYHANNMFAHTFHPQLKSIQKLIESNWPDEVHKCRLNKFRGQEDLAAATFLHHHLAILEGKGIAASTSCMYFNVRTPFAKQCYRSLLARKGTSNAPYSMCLNDHTSINRSATADYALEMKEFLNSYYPHPSEFEIPIRSTESDSSRAKEGESIDDNLMPKISNILAA